MRPDLEPVERLREPDGVLWESRPRVIAAATILSTFAVNALKSGTGGGGTGSEAEGAECTALMPLLFLTFGFKDC